MYNYKKYTALAMSILLCVPSAIAPCSLSYAENGPSAPDFITEEEAEEVDDDETVSDAEETVIESGDYSYSENADGTINLLSCAVRESVIDVPETIDGKTVAEIHSNAFKDCAGFAETINIPACVTYISGDNPFTRCERVSEINIAEDNPNYCSVDGILYSKDKTSLLCYPQSKFDTRSFVIPENVTHIGIAAFYEVQLDEITIPDSVESIERHAFSYSAIKSIDLSNTKVSTISAMAFTECKSLTEVLLPDTVTSIEIAAFQGCKALTDFTIPNNVTALKQNAFLGTGLKTIVVPPSVTDIGYSALGYDEHERAITDFIIVGVPNTAAYNYCFDADDEYEYSNDFQFMTIDDYEKQKLYESLNIQTSGYYDYFIDENGEAVIFACNASDSVTEVPDTFGGSPVTKIYENAFLGCTAEELILPDSVKIIGDSNFPETLVKLSIPGGCTSIEGTEPFVFCYSLKEINVREGDGAFSSENGVLYNKDKSVLICYPMDKEDTSFTVPSSVKTLSISSFCKNDHLESVDISSVTTIGTYAFDKCINLKNVKFSKDLVTVGNDAFYNCPELKSVTLYDKVEEIGDYAFGYFYDKTPVETEETTNADTEAEAETEDDIEVVGDVAVKGFKIYAPKDSLGYEYAVKNGLKAVSGTIRIGNMNIGIALLSVIIGAVVLLLSFIGVSSGKKKKSENKSEKAKKEENKDSDDEKENDKK